MQLYVLPAANAPVAAVFARRGPWVLIARWDLRTGKAEPGAWFRGTIYQRRCDLSPDGELLYYFALKGGSPFHAISKLPYLTALAWWRDDSTYTRGGHFEALAGSTAKSTFRDPPDQGSLAPLATRYRLRLVPNTGAPYDAERRRGWAEHSRAVPRAKTDVWDERRPQWLVRARPDDNMRLELHDRGHTRGRFEGRVPSYTLDGAPLDGVRWADWDHRGRLLVATDTGCLEIRSANGAVKHSASLAERAPDPRPAPRSAQQW